MDNKVAGIIGAVGAFMAVDAAHAAAPTPPSVDAVMQVESYADLLKPIPNAVAVLQASDAAASQAELLGTASDGDATIQTVQFHHHHHHRFYGRFYHHHHHHHRFFRRFHHHHHHHFREY